MGVGPTDVTAHLIFHGATGGVSMVVYVPRNDADAYDRVMRVFKANGVVHTKHKRALNPKLNMIKILNASRSHVRQYMRAGASSVTGQ